MTTNIATNANLQAGESTEQFDETRYSHSPRSKKAVCFLLYIALVAVALVILSQTFIPLAKLSKQRETQVELQTRLTSLETENTSLTSQVSDSKRDSSIQRLAQGEYNLIYPGQQMFVLLP